jgi:hypothetical protein
LLIAAIRIEVAVCRDILVEVERREARRDRMGLSE